MKNSCKCCFLTVFILFGVSGIWAQEKSPKLEDLKWVAGCWEINKPEKKSLVSEQWMAPVGDAMIGMSRTMRNGKKGGFEFLRIVQNDTGIFYISKPSENSEETSFKLIKLASNEVTFENPTHDFPKIGGDECRDGMCHLPPTRTPTPIMPATGQLSPSARRPRKFTPHRSFSTPMNSGLWKMNPADPGR